MESMGEVFKIKVKKTLWENFLDLLHKIKCKIFCCFKSKCSLDED
jgi:hypothetical protein